MIFALVTLYNPTEEQIRNLSKIKEQVDTVIACDNSRDDNSERMPIGVYYSSSNRNLGLSMAFNNALKDQEYGWKDDDYIVFFDQDSRIEHGHIRQLILDYEDCVKSGVRIGCLGPIFHNTSNGITEIPHDKKKIINGIYEVKSLITSSMICKYGVLKKVHFWNEEVFLDMADWDLCWRFVQDGYKCCMTSNVILYHSLGTGEKRIGILRMMVAAPIREYYEIRDCLYLKNKDYTPLKFKIRFVAMLTLRSLIHILAYDDKSKRLYYIKRGVADYKKNIHGEFVRKAKH